MAYENILVETRGRVGLVTLNRPKALNALNDALMDELGNALAAFDADEGIGAMVVTGSDKAFAAGADIGAMKDRGYMDVYKGEYITRNWERMKSIRKPIIAAVAGYALGGGCELAMMCDMLFAADTARFGQPEIKLGIIPGAGGTQRLPRAVGKAKAMDLVLTGRMMDAAEAVLAPVALLVLWTGTLRLGVAARTAELSHALESVQKHEKEVLRLNAELEQRITERTAQLTLANRELQVANEQLESFSYSVSHDLRAPLRHIDGFSKLLREHAQDLDPKSLGFLDTIATSAKWMGRLLDDLLALARTTRQEFHPVQIDLDWIVASAREQCLPDAGERKVQWKIGRLPAVQGDGTLLRAVFVNLLSNAIKFTSRREVALVEVGALPGDEGEAVIYVKDNGAGFDMRYAKKLFGVVQRLHAQREFQGTGVGLAAAQRIIPRP